MFKDACNGEHTTFIAEKFCSTFAVKGGTNKDNRYESKGFRAPFFNLSISMVKAASNSLTKLSISFTHCCWSTIGKTSFVLPSKISCFLIEKFSLQDLLLIMYWQHQNNLALEFFLSQHFQFLELNFQQIFIQHVSQFFQLYL